MRIREIDATRFNEIEHKTSYAYTQTKLYKINSSLYKINLFMTKKKTIGTIEEWNSCWEHFWQKTLEDITDGGLFSKGFDEMLKIIEE